MATLEKFKDENFRKTSQKLNQWSVEFVEASEVSEWSIAVIRGLKKAWKKACGEAWKKACGEAAENLTVRHGVRRARSPRAPFARLQDLHGARQPLLAQRQGQYFRILCIALLLIFFDFARSVTVAIIVCWTELQFLLLPPRIWPNSSSTLPRKTPSWRRSPRPSRTTGPSLQTPLSRTSSGEVQTPLVSPPTL